MNSERKTALLIIDVQNDYFADGNFPLWNADTCLENTIKAVKAAKEANMPIVMVQHVADEEAPFFAKGTNGVNIHSRLSDACDYDCIVIKKFADSFYKTKLSEILEGLDITDLLICGMMTHNCVTHTAISKSVEKFHVKVIADCCTTVSEILHNIALNALSIRVEVVKYSDVF